MGPPMIQLDIEICGASFRERLAGDIAVVMKDRWQGEVLNESWSRSCDIRLSRD
jgi:hypothetical protein